MPVGTSSTPQPLQPPQPPAQQPAQHPTQQGSA